MLSALLSTILQVLVFSAVPFLTYAVSQRRVRGFFSYVGLYGPGRRTMGWATLVAVLGTLLFLLLFSIPRLRELATAPNTVVGRLRSLGFSGTSIFVLVLYALFQTSLSEEILFRGFLAKRLIGWLGFGWGNLLQALLFGVVHLLLFVGPGAQSFSWLSGIVVVVLVSLLGWALGFVNESIGNGSIMPSWWAHGASNLLAYSVLAFVWR